MNISAGKNQLYTGIALAIAATLVWSGNFIVASGIAYKIPPVSLAFYRWLIATFIMAPLAFSKLKAERQSIVSSYRYLFWVSLTGIACFNTFIYIAGRFLPAINLVLIATTSSPVMSAVLAAIFLKEKFTWRTFFSLLLCISGVAILVSRGTLATYKGMAASSGNWWVLVAALMFAIYNILARKKPSSISPLVFLFIIFAMGTILLLPVFIWETIHITNTAFTDYQLVTATNPHLAPWNYEPHILWAIVYLGIGASVISYLCWNAAIKRLGAARTALFGNLIPIFSALEAVVILKEHIELIHIVSGSLVIAGLLIANVKKKL